MDNRQLLNLTAIKVRLNLRSEASRNWLNYAWWILEPALFVGVFYIVFGVLLQRGGPNFVAFLVCGQIPYLWYSRSVMNSSNSIVAGKSLISHIDLPKVFFPLVVIFQDSVKQFFVFTLLVVFLVLYGIHPTINWLYLPFVAVVQGSFIIASGLVAACIVPIIPDFRFIISTGMTLLLFGSGVFYSYEALVQNKYQEIFLLNPMAALIKNYRQVLLNGEPPDFGRLLTIFVICSCIAYGAHLLLRKYHGKYSRFVMQ